MTQSNRQIPPFEACAGSLCANCVQFKAQLKRCTRCKRSWYCNAECQKQHWPQHKAICKAAAPHITALTQHILELPLPDSYAAAYDPIRDAGHDCLRGRASTQIGPLLFPAVSRMIAATVICNTCFRIREQVPAEQHSSFRCCSTCRWGWCCSDSCWSRYRAAHEKVCPTFKRMADCQLLSLKHLRNNDNPDGQVTTWCQTGKIPAAEVGRLPSSWKQYKQYRRAPPFLGDLWCCMTHALCVPLTAVLATTKLYKKQQLRQMTEFTLHLIGSSNYEWQTVGMTCVIEEIMHLLPAVKGLNVIMAGPELVPLLAFPETYKEFDTGCCPCCEQEGCKRFYGFYRGRYEDYAASSDYRSPTLALCLNSGVGCDSPFGRLSWAPVVQVLLEKGVPTCFTSYQEKEAAEDSQALCGAGARIVSGPDINPFASQIPHWDRSEGPDCFYRMNGYFFCIKGRADIEGQ